MFNELPKLLDRRFITGFSFPLLVFFLVVYGVMEEFITDGLPIDLSNTDFVAGTALIVILLYISSLLLMGLNHNLVRFLEGYQMKRYVEKLDKRLHYVNFIDRMHSRQVNKFNRLQRKISDLAQEIAKSKQSGKSTANLEREIGKLRICRAEEFPYPPSNVNDTSLILPTKLGNIIRAFERYPTNVYGIESIQGWTRLEAIIDEDYIEKINDSRAFFNMWINFRLLSFLLLLIFPVLAITQEIANADGLLLSSIMVILFYWFASNNACQAAKLWGEYVKSAFDVYLPKLAQSMNFEIATKEVDAKQLWSQLNVSMLYRLPLNVPEKQPASPDGDSTPPEDS